MADEGALAVVGSLATALGAIGLLLQTRNARLHREIAPVLSAAYLEAALRDQVHITVEHLALAVTFEPDVERQMRSEGIDVERLRERLEARLGPLVHSGFANEPPSVRPLRDAATERVLGTARGTRIAPSPLAVYSSLFGPCESLLRALVDDARTAPRSSGASSREPSPYRTGPGGPAAQLRLWNDPRTTMEFVTRTLVEQCGRSAAHARYLMLHTHMLGSAVALESASLDEAREAADRIERAARERGFPLRVTVEPAGSRPPGWLARLALSRASPRSG